MINHLGLWQQKEQSGIHYHHFAESLSHFSCSWNRATPNSCRATDFQCKAKEASYKLLSKYKYFSAAAKTWAHPLQVYKRSKKHQQAVFLNLPLLPPFSEKGRPARATTLPPHHHHHQQWSRGGTTEQAQAWQIFQVEKRQQTKLPTLQPPHPTFFLLWKTYPFQICTLSFPTSHLERTGSSFPRDFVH